MYGNSLRKIVELFTSSYCSHCVTTVLQYGRRSFAIKYTGLQGYIISYTISSKLKDFFNSTSTVQLDIMFNSFRLYVPLPEAGTEMKMKKNEKTPPQFFLYGIKEKNEDSIFEILSNLFSTIQSLFIYSLLPSNKNLDCPVECREGSASLNYFLKWRWK